MPTPSSSSASLLKPGIQLDEYVKRRSAVLRALNGSAALVLAGEGGGHGPFRADQHFFYLTGIADEPGAAVLFNPASEDPRRRIVLFLKPIDPEMDRWDRYRDMISVSMKAALGFDTVMRLTSLPAMLASAARRCGKLACLHPFSGHSTGVSPDLALYRKVQERVPGVGVEDRSMLLNERRGVKSPGEQALMIKAANATAAGYAQVLAQLRPGHAEATVARTLESAYLDAGAQGTAYESICGSGLNATVLHYRDNAGVCRDGELLLIDSGARYQGYCCDVTRTLPVSGVFSDEQAELYHLVLRAQMAALKAVKPGAYFWQIDKAARDVIDRGGFADAYFHGTGHHLGLDVHDAAPDGPLKPGMVITVEPGIYLPERRIGIRIEDSVLVTPRGHKNLTSSIPKTIAEIESTMKRSKR